VTHLRGGCVLFNHAIRYEWLEQGRNPITLVRQSAKRKSIPEVLDPNEIQGLLLQLDSCFRLMVMLGVTTGLRRSELFALKWLDVDFSNLTVDVQRSIYLLREDWKLQDRGIPQTCSIR
jgi:integrase